MAVSGLLISWADAGSETAQGDQFFRLRHLLLNVMKIFDGVAGELDKVAQFEREQVKFPVD